MLASKSYVLNVPTRYISGEGLEEAVRKWMINPKTPKPHQAVLGEGGIMGDIEWVIVGGSYAGCCVSHERGEDLFTEDSQRAL